MGRGSFRNERLSLVEGAINQTKTFSKRSLARMIGFPYIEVSLYVNDLVEKKKVVSLGDGLFIGVKTEDKPMKPRYY